MNEKKVKALLSKKDQMSYSDIKTLLDLGVEKSRICNALGINEENRDLYDEVDFSTAENFYKTYAFVLEEMEIRKEENNPKKMWQKIAQENGISRQTFRRRIMTGMDYDEAATKPVNKGIPEHIRELAKENGLRYNTVYYRIKNLGMDPIEAATKKTPRQLKNGA